MAQGSAFFKVSGPQFADIRRMEISGRLRQEEYISARTGFADLAGATHSVKYNPDGSVEIKRARTDRDMSSRKGPKYSPHTDNGEMILTICPVQLRH
ncbi:hypothetical protein [Citrobacter sp. MGH109]|uniref:hypothetical protein n=1 Tax=Citrobacter sp. MGH109 TaxID=1686382 RepID=UPI0006510A14|nr:hypothetical protein [Citrobacter sp. MGH109]